MSDEQYLPAEQGDAAPAETTAAGTASHEHVWRPCDRCPNPGQACACAGGVCCQAETTAAELAEAERYVRWFGKYGDEAGKLVGRFVAEYDARSRENERLRAVRDRARALIATVPVIAYTSEVTALIKAIKAAEITTGGES